MLSKIGFAILVISSLVSCGDVNLKAPDEPVIQAKSKGEFCTFNPEEKSGKLIYMFIIDVSGSNKSSGTDSNGMRIQRAMQFLSDNRNDSSVGWSLLGFDGSTHNYVGDPEYGDVTFDPNRMQSALDAMIGNHARGGTKFKTALEGAESVIETHIALPERNSDKFMVFFLSDGQPSDISSPSGVHGPVQSLLETHPGKVKLSSAFYGGFGSGARRIVEEMAKVGGGEFKNWNDVNDVDFNDLLQPDEKLEAWKINNFLVYNLNSAICSDNYYGLDSDADGLCDQDEIQFTKDFQDKLAELGADSFDPARRNSVIPGIADYFVWMHFKNRLGRIEECPIEMRVDADHDFLNECEENLIENFFPNGTTWTTANPKDPDTDNDGVLDSIEQWIFRDRMTSPLNNLNIFGAFYDQENVNAEQQILEHRNPLYPDEDAPKYDTRVRKTDELVSGQICYSFEQTQLEVFETLEVNDIENPHFSHKAGENIILIYFLQSKTNNNHEGKGIYMRSLQTLNFQNGLYNGLGLNVNDDAFTPYMVYEQVDVVTIE